MKTPSSTALVLLLAAAPAFALPPAPASCDPNKRPDTREGLLAAMTDEAQRNRALGQVGISKQADGKWSSMNGGVIAALPLERPLNQAYDLYCAALARAAAEAARSERVAANQAAIRAEPRPVPTVDARVTAPKVKTDLASRLGAAISSLGDSLGTTAEDSAAVTPAPANCEHLRSQVGTCDDGGAGAGNLPTDFKCRKARADLRALCR